MSNTNDTTNEKITHEFQRKYSLEKRIKESASIMEKYNDRIPVIVETADENLPELDKKKFLVPADLNAGQFSFIIRKRLKLKAEEAMFLFVNDNTLVSSSLLMSQIYENHKHIDNYLYLSVVKEKTFG